MKDKMYLRKLILICSIICIIVSIAFIMKNYLQIEKRQIQSTVTNSGVPLLSSLEDEELGKIAKITSSEITDRKTGVGPFDSDNEPGNDSSADNNIVRSFDQVTWTIENTIGLKTGGSANGKSGVIEVRAELPDTCQNVVWDINSMSWAENANISDDGRVFTGQYRLEESSVSIKQILVFTASVLNASNESEISPTFTLNLAGNEEDEKVTVKDSDIVKVSAKGKYNIKLVRNTDWNSERVSLDYDSYNNVSGRMYGYYIILQIMNDDVSKGLKGLEYPKEDIKFDINLKMQKSSNKSPSELEDITQDTNIMLWNYKITNNNEVGNIANRTMKFNSITSHGSGGSKAPYGIASMTREASVYNSGTIDMEQNQNKISTTINSYAFDGTFPTRNYSTPAGTTEYTQNIGCFFSGYFQIFIPDNEATESDDFDYYLTVSDENFSATSISGEEIKEQMLEDDDSEMVIHNRYHPGTYSQALWLFYGDTDTRMSSVYTEGDAKAMRNDEINAHLDVRLALTNEDYVYTVDKFFKFDGEAVEPRKYNDSDYFTVSEEMSPMTFKMWFVTKPDGSNWADQTEMNNALIENMNMYEKIEEIPDNYLIVGEFFESQNGYCKTPRDYSLQYIKAYLKVKETAKINNTYGFTQSCRYWLDELDRTEYSQDVKEGFSEYPKPIYQALSNRYIKTEYDENGKIVAGTHAGNYGYGNSLLIVAATQKIGIQSIDDDGNEKINYEVEKNDVIAKFKISPSITAESSEEVSDVTIKVKCVLPQGLTYIPNSCSIYGDPQIQSDSGVTTLAWIINDCKVNQKIEDIIYSVKINEDIENGTECNVTTTIEEVISEDGISKIGNARIEERTANTSIKIINLATYRLNKTTDTPIIEKNGDIHYKITAVNITNNPVVDFKLLDILPYNGDERGTNYHGNYTVSKIEMKQTGILSDDDIGTDKLNLYVSADTSVRENVTVKDDNIGSDSAVWSNYNSGDELNQNATAYAVVGTLDASATLDIDIYIKTQENQALDIYKNSASVQTNKQTEAMESPIATVNTIKRSLNGYVWIDSNRDGLITSGEEYLQGVNVSLLNDDGTPVQNLDSNPIETTTNENGYYSFEDLAIGEYKVKISIDDEIYELTQKEVGQNSQINSKFDSNKVTDVYSEFNSMGSPEIKVDYVNAGLLYKETSVLVHYRELGTQKTLSEDRTIYGHIEDDYNTEEADDIPANYELVETDGKTSGKMTKDQIEVTYYYKLKDPSIASDMSKNTTGELTDLSDKIQYKIEYTATIEDYIGDATLTIVDKLPYHIDDTASNLANGEYNDSDMTITWTEEIKNIDSYEDQNNEITISKEIELVYTDIDTSKESITNTVSGKLHLKTPEKDDEVQASKTIITGYEINIPVTKVWDDDNNANGKRPSEIEIVLNENGTEKQFVTLSSANETAENKWTYEFENLPTHDSTGNLITYSVEEREKNIDDLKYYETEITGNDDVVSGVTITNTSIYAKVIVHHYIVDTNTKVPSKNVGQVQDELIEGIIGESYNTYESNDIAANYELVETDGEISGKMTKNPIEVTYYYKLIDTENTTPKITKESNDVLNKRSDIITYNISYNTQISYYVGKAKVIFVDTLEYSINEIESNLDGGVYDPTNKTITWEIDLGDIDTIKTGENVPVQVNIKKTISLLYENVDVTKDIITNEIKGTIFLIDSNKSEDAIDTEDVDINVMGRVDVVYKDKNTDEEISDRIVKEGREGHSFDISEDKKDLDGYTLIEEPNPKTGTFTEEIQEKVYYYAKNTKVIVNYIDKISGELLDQIEEYGCVGKTYTSESKNIENYVLDEKPDEESVVMTENVIVLNYYYVHISAGVIEKHIDIVSNNLLDNTFYEGNEGDLYTTNSKEFEGYDIVTNKRYYSKYVEKHPEFLEENKVETVEELLEKLEKEADSPYIPDNVEGTMEIDVIEINYYYVRRVTLIVEHYDNETNDKIAEDEVSILYEGDNYSTNYKDITGYEVVNSRMPENKEGIVEKEGIVVRYYYNKKQVQQPTLPAIPNAGDNLPMFALGMTLLVIILNTAWILINKRKK